MRKFQLPSHMAVRPQEGGFASQGFAFPIWEHRALYISNAPPGLFTSSITW